MSCHHLTVSPPPGWWSAHHYVASKATKSDNNNSIGIADQWSFNKSQNKITAELDLADQWSSADEEKEPANMQTSQCSLANDNELAVLQTSPQSWPAHNIPDIPATSDIADKWSSEPASEIVQFSVIVTTISHLYFILFLTFVIFAVATLLFVIVYSYTYTI